MLIALAKPLLVIVSVVLEQRTEVPQCLAAAFEFCVSGAHQSAVSAHYYTLAACSASHSSTPLSTLYWLIYSSARMAAAGAGAGPAPVAQAFALSGV